MAQEDGHIVLDLNEREAQVVFEGLHILTAMGVDGFQRAYQQGALPRQAVPKVMEAVDKLHGLAHKFDPEDDRFRKGGHGVSR